MSILHRLFMAVNHQGVIMRNKIYALTNIIVILIASIWFLVYFKDTKKLFFDDNNLILLILIITALMVYVIKFLRLYFAMYGTNITFEQFAEIYVRVTPISLILPFKVGELFRIYCYGKQINNCLQGGIIILLDRFMDTAALITMITITLIFNKNSPTYLVYFLFCIMFLLSTLYFVFPGMYCFWRKFILRSDASKNKLRVLKTLVYCNTVYDEIVKVVKGRGIILFFLSLFAWIIEIGSLAVTTNMVSINTSIKISEYITSAMTGHMTLEMRRFIFISVVMLLNIYLLLWIVKLLHIKRRN